MVVASTYTDLGSYSIIIELVDEEGLTNEYFLDIYIVDTFQFQQNSMNKVIIYYPDIVTVNISELLAQSIDHSFVIQILENNKSIKWGNYVPINQSILFSSYDQNDFGEHNLTISIYDGWFLRHFNSNLTVVISLPHPPSSSGKISNITAYQGQKKIYLKVDEGMFYSESQKFMVAPSMWTDARITSNVSQIYFTNFNPPINFGIILEKNYIGRCQSSLVAIDSYLQTSLISFFINVLKWPQPHWLYWNGENAVEWTEWVPGFIIDPLTGEWMTEDYYFDKWILISFAIAVLTMTILTDHDVNASYILLESITLYWMLFSVFEREWRIKQYFNQISVVITHFNSLIFPLFDSTFSISGDSNVTTNFFVNWTTIIVAILIFVMFHTCQKNMPTLRKITYFLRIQAISKYMLWASTYVFFWIIYELSSINELTDIRILSYAATLVFTWIISIFVYWFAIHSNKNWWIWTRYAKINNIRQDFRMLDIVKPRDYALIVRYSIGRKLVFSIMITLQLKLNLSSFLFTFVIISAQLMYSNLIIGLWLFKSLLTRGLMISNEAAMNTVVLLASIEYLNLYLDSNSSLSNLEYILLLLVRIHVLLIIGVEFLRIFRLIISKITIRTLSWIWKKHRD